VSAKPPPILAHLRSFRTAYAVLLACLALAITGAFAGRQFPLAICLLDSALLFALAIKRVKSQAITDELVVQLRASQSALRNVNQQLDEKIQELQRIATMAETPLPPREPVGAASREIVHAFKNALAGVLGNVSLLREAADLPVAVRDRLTLMEQSALKARQFALDLFPSKSSLLPQPTIIPPPRPANRVPPRVTPRGSGRVLVMDDEQPIRVLLGAILQHFGYEATAVTDGTEAIREYKKALDTGNPFKAVIMDLAIPGAMGGREAIGELRTLDPNVRAIVTSGYSDDPAIMHYKKHGFAGRIEKPYRAEDVGTVLNQILTVASN
jgi:CheY-like chemotaxis protein